MSKWAVIGGLGIILLAVTAAIMLSKPFTSKFTSSLITMTDQELCTIDAEYRFAFSDPIRFIRTRLARPNEIEQSDEIEIAVNGHLVHYGGAFSSTASEDAVLEKVQAGVDELVGQDFSDGTVLIAANVKQLKCLNDAPAMEHLEQHPLVPAIPELAKSIKRFKTASTCGVRDARSIELHMAYVMSPDGYLTKIFGIEAYFTDHRSNADFKFPEKIAEARKNTPQAYLVARFADTAIRNHASELAHTDIGEIDFCDVLLEGNEQMDILERYGLELVGLNLDNAGYSTEPHPE